MQKWRLKAKVVKRTIKRHSNILNYHNEMDSKKRTTSLLLMKGSTSRKAFQNWKATLNFFWYHKSSRVTTTTSHRVADGSRFTSIQTKVKCCIQMAHWNPATFWIYWIILRTFQFKSIFHQNRSNHSILLCQNSKLLLTLLKSLFTSSCRHQSAQSSSTASRGSTQSHKCQFRQQWRRLKITLLKSARHWHRYSSLSPSIQSVNTPLLGAHRWSKRRSFHVLKRFQTASSLAVLCCLMFRSLKVWRRLEITLFMDARNCSQFSFLLLSFRLVRMPFTSALRCCRYRFLHLSVKLALTHSMDAWRWLQFRLLMTNLLLLSR